MTVNKNILRKWKIRKLKSAGLDIEEEFSDDEIHLELSYINSIPTWLQEKKSNLFLKNMIELSPNSELTEAGNKESELLRFNKKIEIKELTNKSKLKFECKQISCFKELLLNAVKKNRILVVIGDTGCGKSTLIPQYLYNEGYGANGIIGVTEPRRIAVKRLYGAVKQVVGEEVGYAVRFESCTNSFTKIKYMTEGILLQELQIDPLLKKYSVLIFDEAHERGLNLDICLGIVKNVLKSREDLKIIIMSATMETDKICNYFNCPIFNIVTNKFPVKIKYLSVNVDDYIEWIIKKIWTIHINEEGGDILSFCTGKRDIDCVVNIINYFSYGLEYDEENSKVYEIFKYMKESQGNKSTKLVAYPMYSQLSEMDQSKIFFSEKGIRKCIVATNIAETSLTIPNIKYVVDSGLCKSITYDYEQGEVLKICAISKASANQRAGRTGRTCPGTCYRMYTEEIYNKHLFTTAIPEIQRVNVCNVILLLLKYNLDLYNFDFIDKPSEELLNNGLYILYNIGAVGKDMKITELGQNIFNFKTDVLLGALILKSVEYGCVNEILTISAVLTAGHICNTEVFSKTKILHKNCDFITILNIFEDYIKSRKHGNTIKIFEQAKKLKDMYTRIFNSKSIYISSNKSPEVIKRCLISVFYTNIAKNRKNSFVCLSNLIDGEIHNSSYVENNAEYILFYRTLTTDRRFFYCCTKIKPEWILEEAKGKFKLLCENLNEEGSNIESGGVFKRGGCDKETYDVIETFVDKIASETKTFEKSKVQDFVLDNNYSDVFEIEEAVSKSEYSQIKIEGSLYDKFEMCSTSDENEDLDLDRTNKRMRL